MLETEELHGGRMRNQERGRQAGDEESSWRRRLAALIPFHDSRVPAPAPLGTGERGGGGVEGGKEE